MDKQTYFIFPFMDRYLDPAIKSNRRKTIIFSGIILILSVTTIQLSVPLLIILWFFFFQSTFNFFFKEKKKKIYELNLFLKLLSFYLA